jgi:hypothetical protein
MNGTYTYWDSPQGRAAVELKIGVSQLFWVKKSALIYMGLTEQCNICSGQSLAHYHPGHSIAESTMDSFTPSEVKRPSTRRKIKEGQCSLGKQPQMSHPVESLPLPDPQISPSVKNRGNWLSLNHYDDYNSAPLHNNSPGEIPDVWSFDSTGAFIVSDTWASWKDRGYRLHPQFSFTITSELPVGHEDHLLPCLPTPQLYSQQSVTLGMDSNIYGLRALLDEAGLTENTIESQKALVGGRDRADQLIELDLEKDAIQVPLDQIQISSDIDSFTWITDQFSAKSMDLHLNVSFGSKPPFSVDNFITVSLVQPPTDESEKSSPHHRTCKDVKLSNIPHMEFAHSGQDHRRVNFIVFFPRMIWKNSQVQRYPTLIPMEVQELWISEVIIPACREVFADNPAISEYIPGSVQELHWKSGNRKHQSVTFTSQDLITNFINTMKDKVQVNPTLLGRYGSFFFAADARGIKLVTKQCLQPKSHQEGLPELAAIFPAFDDLDWEYMLDRSHGELYLDLGISFHTKQDIPLVGLWRLNKLHESYELMGMKKGDVHHFSTFGNYGGRKAAMKKERQQIVHIKSRISYNLAFELVRNPGTLNYIVSDIEAVKNSDRFLGASQSWLNLFKEGKQKSYGVRDEVRGTALAIQDMLKVASLKVQLHLLQYSSLQIC